MSAPMSTTMSTRPPGPGLPRIAQSLMFMFDPVKAFERCARRYGPVFTLHALGFPPEVFVATSALAEQVYALDAGGGRAGEVRRQFLEPVVGQHSLLSLDGEPWRRHRKLLSPPLHGRAIAAYREQIAEITAGHVEAWPVGEPFALRDTMQEITLEVILRIVFGINDANRLRRLRLLVPRLVDLGASAAITLTPPGIQARLERSPVAKRLRFLPTTRFVAVRDAVDDILYAEIAQRWANPRPDATDVLSRLVEARDEDGRPMSDQELRDELITLLEAGHETTATALAWAFERLVRNEAVLGRLRAELDAGGEDYLEAMVKEALRSRPVVFDAPRLLDEPLRLGGYEIPAGWFAAPLILMIHRDPEAFPNPEEFRPERFLGEQAAQAAKSWMPFGGGRRYCVGAQLALMEMRVIITEVLRRVEIAAADPEPEAQKVRHVTLVPAKKARIVVTPRATSGG